MIRFLQTPGPIKKIVLGGLLTIISVFMVITLVPGFGSTDFFGSAPTRGIVAKVAGTDITGGNLRFEREGGMGTYRLSNFTLILHYSDGYERGLPILIRPEDQDQPMPPAVLVNTYTLIRR